jgi:hypothetical protein
MPAIKTAGAHTCAVIAIGNFKAGNQYDLNEQYLKDTNPDKMTDSSYIIEGGMSVQEFYDDIIYPTEQPLGETAIYPFDMLMDLIDESEMEGKLIIANLADFQYNFQDKYWHNRLKERGFELVDKTNNDIGGLNYFYIRNNNRVEIAEGEK